MSLNERSSGPLSQVLPGLARDQQRETRSSLFPFFARGPEGVDIDFSWPLTSKGRASGLREQWSEQKPGAFALSLLSRI